MTAISKWLVETGRVAFVVHMAPDPDDQLLAVPTTSGTALETEAGLGSRYVSSAPLERILEYLERGEPFAVSLKPCDIAGIRNLQRRDERARKLIRFTMAMYCGTVPGLDANLRFLKKHGIERENDSLVLFRWRGYGCPGDTIAETASGRTARSSHREMWRENKWSTQFRCKICPDAIGLQADIAVGDCWPGGKPSRTEHENENAILVHTEIGSDVLEGCVADGAIEVVEETLDILHRTQPHHTRLRQSLAARLAAMRDLGQPLPEFRQMGLQEAALLASADDAETAYAGMKARLERGDARAAWVSDYTETSD